MWEKAVKTVTNPSPVDIYVLCGGGGGKNNVPFGEEKILFGQSLLYWPFFAIFHLFWLYLEF